MPRRINLPVRGRRIAAKSVNDPRMAMMSDKRVARRCPSLEEIHEKAMNVINHKELKSTKAIVVMVSIGNLQRSA